MSDRDQFEAWFSDGGKYPHAVERSGEGYFFAAANSQWEAWQASREALKAEQGVDAWISCAERMPENSQDVTMFSESKGVINGYYFGWNGEDKKWYAACGEYEGPEEDVTHWQPLPSPPATNHPIDTTPAQYDALGKGGEQ